MLWGCSPSSLAVRSYLTGGEMGMIERLREGAEQAASRARESVQEAELRHDLALAYGELGRATFALLEQGGLSDGRLGAGVERIRTLEGQLASIPCTRGPDSTGT